VTLTLTFDLLTSLSMRAERLLYSISVPGLVLIAQAVFLLEHGQRDKQTDKQTDATERPTHAGDYTTSVCNKWSQSFDERPHRRPVAPTGGKWIRPTLTASNTCFFTPT